MHGSIRDELENLLAGKSSSAAVHVSGCTECASDMKEMRAHSSLLKTLRPDDTSVETDAGFYARVLQRIEASAKRSIWWVFVYSPVGARLAYASLALTVALGSYMVAAESHDGHLKSASTLSATLATGHYDVPVVGTMDQQRAAVLENFASHPVSTE